MGILSVGFGVVGVFLPLLPTVPFLLLAAICFTRSSKKLHDWLLNHTHLGPPIHNWYERGAISRNAKLWATAVIVATLAISLIMDVGATILLLQVVILGGVLTFIWTRPNE